MTCYIHVGFSKTGTSSIQRSLLENVQRLKDERSTYYPSFSVHQWPAALPFVGRGQFIPLENHVQRRRGTREAAWNDARTFVKEFTEEAPSHETQVISSEQFQSLDDNGTRRFKAFFNDLGLDTKIVVYVRHPAERVSSLLSQMIFGGHTSLRTYRPVDETTPAIQKHVRIFGKDNIIIRRFGKQYFPGGDIMADFMAAIGQPPLEGLVGPHVNESLSLPAVLIGDRLFDFANLYSGNRGDDRYLRRISGSKFRVTRAMAEEAISVHGAGMDYLATEFGVHFDPVDLSTFPEQFDHTFSKESLRSLAEILNENSRVVDVPLGKSQGQAPALSRGLRSVVGRVRRLVRP